MLMRYLALALIAVGSASCTYTPKIISASFFHPEGGEEIELTIQISRSDAAYIKKRQYSFFIVLTECGSDKDQYPIEPFVGSERAARFSFPTSGSVVNIAGTAPVSIAERYRAPCVHLRGGAYFFGTMRSNSVPIVDRPLGQQR